MIFKFKPGYRITPALLILNILMFLVVVVMNGDFSSFSNRSMLMLGANFSPLVEQGQWWRFVTSMFLHFSPTHILFNGVSLIVLGRFIEPLLGSVTFFLVYMLSGIAGSAASFIFNPGVISAGASGAIFGLFGVVVAVLLTNIVRADIRKEWLKSVGTILVLNLGIGLILPVDNAAHIGGLISGIILGLLSIPLIKTRLRKMLHNLG